MRFCQFCGTKLPDEALFCMACGRSLGTFATNQSTTISTRANSEAPVPGSPPEQTTLVTQQESANKREQESVIVPFGSVLTNESISTVSGTPPLPPAPTVSGTPSLPPAPTASGTPSLPPAPTASGTPSSFPPMNTSHREASSASPSGNVDARQSLQHNAPSGSPFPPGSHGHSLPGRLPASAGQAAQASKSGFALVLKIAATAIICTGLIVAGIKVVPLLVSSANSSSTSGNNGSRSSSTTSTVLPAPVLLSPANLSVFNTYPRTTTLQWQAVPGAVSYTVEWFFLAFTPDLTHYYCDKQTYYQGHQIVPLGSSTQTSYTFDFVGAQPGCWEVWAVDASGQAGTTSALWQFAYTE